MVSERLAPGRWTWALSANDATQDHSSSDPAATRPRAQRIHIKYIGKYLYAVSAATLYVYYARNIII